MIKRAKKTIAPQGNRANLAKKMLSFRAKHEVSQIELAKKLGISQSLISAMECERVVPSTKTALKLQKLFNSKR